MTVLRREDVQSRGASWDECPYRISSSPIPAIVPLAIRRLRGPSLTRGIYSSIHWIVVSLARPYRCRLERGPQEAR
jgi:hypothetical protein